VPSGRGRRYRRQYWGLRGKQRDFDTNSRGTIKIEKGFRCSGMQVSPQNGGGPTGGEGLNTGVHPQKKKK